jgi:predicted Zn-dependent protease with MMP-like domain
MGHVRLAGRPGFRIHLWHDAKVITMTTDEFEDLVDRALEDIPEQLRSGMDNVMIQVDDTSPPGPLFGLYQGVPLTSRGHYAGAMPDRITIFKQTICNAFHTEDEVERQVRKTVIHEVGHHFGIGDARLKELGW